ncbi:MAG TPA: MerR family transcriptional regulator, partial [Candidatus Limnocylindrales bacterium]
MAAEPIATASGRVTTAAELAPEGPAHRVSTRLVGTVGIEEAARLVGVSPSAIRLWERQELVAPRRTNGGTRRYDSADLDRLVAVRRWRHEGLNAAAIRRLSPSAPAAGARADRTARRASSPGIGARLKALRAARRLTLRTAAARSGLSVSFISSLERGLTGASLTALRRLVGVYGVTVGELGASVHEGRADVHRLVRGSERRVLEAAPGVRIEDLFAGPTALESQLFVLAPGASSEGFYAHPGEEFMYVLAGSLGVWLAGTEEFYRLEQGDALTFPSTVEHRIAALGPDETRVI